MPELHHGFVAVRFRKGLTPGDRRVATGDGLVEPYRRRHDLPGEAFALLRVAPGSDSSPARHGRAMARLRRHPDVVRVAPVHRHGRIRAVATDRIWLGLRGSTSAPLRRLLARGARLLHAIEGEHLIELPATWDPLAECRRLGRLASVDYAEPDLVLLGRDFVAGGAARPGLATRQYAFQRIDAAGAWRLQPGGRSVVVAVLDCGVLRAHPDLRHCLVAAYDATGRGNATRPRPWDAHGTECAGLVAGTHRGGTVKGVGFGCGIASVRIGYTPSPLGDYLTKPSWICRGIDWAWRHGAGVLNMSFGGGPASTPVARALQRARTRGRNGKGCVLVAAAGNSGGRKVEFPASLAGVLAVGATDRADRPAPFSNRGREVGIAAPGVNVYTCSIPDPAEGEPALWVIDSGTSLATPIVAGAAALVLSADPNLSERAVRRVLADTAAKPARVRFVKGRSDRLGAGRLDVRRAVAAARKGQDR